MKNTLYVTDLDGTLLNSDAAVAKESEEILNRLIKKGNMITYATARAFATASVVTAGVDFRFPAVVYNGTFIVDAVSGRRLREIHFEKTEADHILETLLSFGISPITYGDIDGRERYSYSPDDISAATETFLIKKRGDPRERLTDEAHLGDGRLFHFTCLGDGDTLKRAHRVLSPLFHTELYRESYVREMCLEVHPHGATKAEAVAELKALLGCDRIVAFGDGSNDLPLFRIADECYATENATQEVKTAATAVIGSNDADGVALWLDNNL